MNCVHATPWIAANDAAWRALCRYWASDDFKAKSMRQSSNRGTESYHTYGGDDHFRLAKTNGKYNLIHFR